MARTSIIATGYPATPGSAGSGSVGSMSDFTMRGINRSQMDDYLARARETEGVTEAGLWRAAFVNVGGALCHAVLDMADAIRDAAEDGYEKPAD